MQAQIQSGVGNGGMITVERTDKHKIPASVVEQGRPLRIVRGSKFTGKALGLTGSVSDNRHQLRPLVFLQGFSPQSSCKTCTDNSYSQGIRSF
jgi:hypothetical protein